MLKKFFFICILYLLHSYIFAEKKFTIAVIPDTQNYTDVKYQRSFTPPFPIDYADIFYRQMEFVSANAFSKGGNIVFAIHLGDLVQHSGRYEKEWKMAYKALSIIDNVLPMIIVPGNHDYDRLWKDENDNQQRIDGSEHFNLYFGPKSKFFKNKEWYGGATENGMNSWSTFKVDDKCFLFLGLEVEPSDQVLEWAQRVLDSHKSYFTLLIMHDYLNVAEELTSPGITRRTGVVYRKEFPNNSATQVWDKLIKNNKQIVFVLCGHSFKNYEGEKARTDLNEDGFKVYQLLSDFQGRTDVLKKSGIIDNRNEGGDGWLRLMEFDLEKKLVNVRTYSTEFMEYEKDTNSDFVIKFDWNWEDRFN